MASSFGGERGRAVAALLAVQLLFGVHYSVAMEIVAHLRPAAWALLRAAGAALLLALWVRASGRRWPRSLRAWGTLGALSILGVVLNQVLFIEGLSRSTTLHSVLVMATIPLQTLLLAAVTGTAMSGLGASRCGRWHDLRREWSRRCPACRL